MEAQQLPRESALVNGKMRYLCRCLVNECYQKESIDPRDLCQIFGRWVASATLSRHREDDANAAALNARLEATDTFGGVLSADRNVVFDSTPQPESTTARAADSGGEANTDDADEEVSGGTRRSKQYIEELSSLTDIVQQEILGFSVSAPLVFTHPPGPESPPYTLRDDIPERPNVGDMALLSSSPRNAVFLAHEAKLYSYLRLTRLYRLEDSPVVESVRLKLQRLLTDQIRQLHDIRGREWEVQRTGTSRATTETFSYGGIDRVYVDCGEY